MTSLGTHIDVIAENIRIWFKKNSDVNKYFDQVYIFGSAINDDGRFFVPNSLFGSDIDLLMRFSENCQGAVERAQALRNLREAKGDLEARICTTLLNGRREKSLVSVLAITDYELYHSIHKGFDPKIFTMNIFHDALTGENNSGGLVDYIDFAYHLENIEAFSVIRACQNVRNAYLDVSRNGESRLKSFDGPDVIPKEVMRAGALLNYVLNSPQDKDARTRLIDGLTFINKVLEIRKECERLFEILRQRQFGRLAKRPCLEVDDIMLLYEVLFDIARGIPKKSIREIIDGFIENK